MRLAVSIAAWSTDPDATVPPEHAKLPAALESVGFSQLQAPVADLSAGLERALTGLESTDTLLVHVSGTLGPEGSLEVGRSESVALSLIADVLALHPCATVLIFVEAAYRGAADALEAVGYVEAVADGLSSHAGSHTTVIAVHPVGGDAGRLAFTHAVLEAARDVVRPDGTALVEDAYGRARERQMGGVAASGFVFLKGEAPFVIGHALRVPHPPASAATEQALPAAPPSAEPVVPAAPPSADPLLLEPARVRVSSDALFVAAALRIGRVSSPDLEAVRASSPEVPVAEVSSPEVPVAEVSSPEVPPEVPVVAGPAVPVADVTAPELPVAEDAEVALPPAEASVADVPPPRAGSPDASGVWIEASDVMDAAPREQLDARIAAAMAAADYRLAVQLCRERLALLVTPEARVDELFEIGRTLVARLRDLPEAVATLEEARGIDPSRLDVLEALRRAYARLARWTEALEVTLALVKLTDDPHERAGLRVAAALLACQHLLDDDYGLELLTAALEDDPTEEAALGELVRIRRSRGDLVDLEHSLAALAHRLVEAGAAARAWDVCQRLASLRRDDLGDAAGAVEALAIAKRLPLNELDSRAVLAEQLLALGDDEGALHELEAIVAAEPGHVRAHARLFSVHLRLGERDRAYLSALVLEELGDADATAREVLEAYRGDWGLRARGALDDAAWDRLRAGGADEDIEAVFRAALRAGVAGQFEDRGKRPALDPARRQPETSTASIVRCFRWAARALGVPCPELYVLDEVAGGIAAVSAPEPTTALGPDVLRGLSSKTLAFLAGRHVTYFRPEYQVLVHFPTIEAAAGLFFAAVELVAPGTVVPPNLAMRVAAAKHRLAKHLRPDELAALSAAVGRLEARDAKVDLFGWIRSVELTAGRAGLLLAGDLQPALAQVRTEARGLTGLEVDERRADLIAFCASRTLGDLRATYAESTPSSMRPPTSESAVVRRDDPSLREFVAAPSSNRLLA